MMETHFHFALRAKRYRIHHLKPDSDRVSILSLKVLITRAPVKECNAFRIKQRRECAVVVYNLASHMSHICCIDHC